MSRFKEDTPIIVCCATGMRSGAARRSLKAQGVNVTLKPCALSERLAAPLRIPVAQHTIIGVSSLNLDILFCRDSKGIFFHFFLCLLENYADVRTSIMIAPCSTSSL